MKLISWLLTSIVLVAALSFALNNRQSVTVSLWPFGIEVVAPLYLFIIGTLGLGLLLGAIIGWISHLPHRIEARRLRRDIAGLREHIEDMRTAPMLDRAGIKSNLSAYGPKWQVWRRRP